MLGTSTQAELISFAEDHAQKARLSAAQLSALEDQIAYPRGGNTWRVSVEHAPTNGLVI
jgi:hypothetical protein